MKKPLLLIGLASLLLQANVYSQTLNWSSSFSPSWSNTNTSGAASNISGSGVAATVDVNATGGAYTYANGVSGSISPTVSGATATVPGSANRLQIGINFATNTNTCTIHYHFTSQITNVSFRVVDIDKLSSTSFSYVDKVTITGSNGAATYNPTITKYDAITDPNFLIISGNTVNANPTSGQSGNSASDATDQRGTVNVNFGSAVINDFTIVYSNHSSTQANPGVQFIAIGNLSFAASTLPVNITSFNGRQIGQDILLSWESQQEINANSFNIERSMGGNWETIGIVAAQGNTGSSSYQYSDINPQGDLLLYRLKQIDNDNNYKYSGIVRMISKDTKIKLLCYPNPFDSHVNININVRDNQLATTVIYDVLGKRIFSEIKKLYSGNNSFNITGLDKLAPGLYHVEIKDNTGNLLGNKEILKN